MEKGKRDYRAHFLVLPYPVQGHINPLLQFSKRLQHKGIKVTLVLTRFASKTFQGESGSVAIDTISDGYDEGKLEEESTEAYFTRFKLVGSQTLASLIDKHGGAGDPIDCVVYDAFLTWALDVAKESGLVGVPFFTQASAVNNIYYHVYKRCVDVPLSGMSISIPGLPVLEPSDTPSFVYDYAKYPAIFDLVVNQFSNVDKADCILFNTFYELEKEVCSFSKCCSLFYSTNF